MYKVKVVLRETLQERGMSLNELSLISDVRRAALSELARGKRENINFEHLAKIAYALGTKDISKIITLVDSKDEDDL